MASPGLSYGMQGLVPWSGIEPGSPAVGAQSLSHWTTSEFPGTNFNVWRVFPTYTHLQEIFRHQLDVLQFNSVLTSAWRECWIPQVKDSVSPCLSPIQIPAASPGYHLCFWLTGCRLDVPTNPTPILGLVSFLEQFTECRESFYSLEAPYLKGCNSGTARWKGCTGQGVWAGGPMSSPRTPHSLHLLCSSAGNSTPHPLEFLWRPDDIGPGAGKDWRKRSKAGEEGDDRGWDGWMASLTQWTWVWVNSGSWWWTGRPGVLQSMGSQKVRHGWATELNWAIT